MKTLTQSLFAVALTALAGAAVAATPATPAAPAKTAAKAAPTKAKHEVKTTAKKTVAAAPMAGGAATAKK